MVYSVGPGLGVGDLDGDGDLDIFVAVPDTQSFIMFNDGKGHFEPNFMVKSNGSALITATAVHLADFDGDGDLDAVVGQRVGEPDYLLLNDGTGLEFTQVSVGTVGSRESKSISVADFNGDQMLDLFVCGFAHDNGVTGYWEDGGTDNALYLAESPGSFVLSETMPEDSLNGLCFQGVPADVDRDGDIDIYITNDHGFNWKRNLLLVNDGHGSFVEAEDCYCDLEIEGMGGAYGDLNEDGWPDILLTDVGRMHLLMNDSTVNKDGVDISFYQAADAVNLSSDHFLSDGWGVTVVDLNQDSWNDVSLVMGAVTNTQQDKRPDHILEDIIYMSTQDGMFINQSSEWNFTDASRGRVLAVGDFNRDGYPDLVTAGFRYVNVWLNKGADCRRGITLHLKGPVGNRHGFGAEVIVTIKDRVVHYWMSPTTMYSSSAPELYLGLGTAVHADKIEVNWPSGKQSLLYNVAPGTITMSTE